MLALSLFYVGGMFLNDAFDHEFDAKHRPERPIPSGQVSAREVFVAGFGLLALGMAGVALASRSLTGMPAWPALVASAALAAAIVFYDAHHKDNPLSPLVMGLCRVLVVLTAAFTVTTALPTAVLLAAVGAALPPDRADLHREAGASGPHRQPVAAVLPGGSGRLRAGARPVGTGGLGAAGTVRRCARVLAAPAAAPRARRRATGGRDADRRHVGTRQHDAGRKRALGCRHGGNRRLLAHAGVATVGIGHMMAGMAMAAESEAAMQGPSWTCRTGRRPQPLRGQGRVRRGMPVQRVRDPQPFARRQVRPLVRRSDQGLGARQPPGLCDPSG